MNTNETNAINNVFHVQDIWGFWTMCPADVYNALVDILYNPSSAVPADAPAMFAGIEIAPGIYSLYDPRSFTKGFAKLGGGPVPSMTLLPFLMGVNTDLIVFPFTRDYDMLIERKRSLIVTIMGGDETSQTSQHVEDQCIHNFQLVSESGVLIAPCSANPAAMADSQMPIPVAIASIEAVTGAVRVDGSAKKRRRNGQKRRTAPVVASTGAIASVTKASTEETSKVSAVTQDATRVTGDEDEGGWRVYYSRKYKKQEQLWRRVNCGTSAKRPVRVVVKMNPPPLQVEADDAVIPGRKFFKWRAFHEQRITHD